MMLEPLVRSFVDSEEFEEYRRRKGGRVSIEGIAPSCFSFITASLFKSDPRQLLVVVKNAQRMQDLCLDLSCFADPRFVHSVTPWETLPYESVSAPEQIERERVSALYRIIGGEAGIFVATVESLIRSVPEKGFLLKKGITLKRGEEYPFADIIESLAVYGYTREHRVESYGHFAVKGGVID